MAGQLARRHVPRPRFSQQAALVLCAVWLLAPREAGFCGGGTSRGRGHHGPGRAYRRPARAAADGEQRLCAQLAYIQPSQIHGWGVFAAADCEEGQVLHRALGRLAPGRAVFGDGNVFSPAVVDGLDDDANFSVVALGFASLHNHADDPNVDFSWERAAEDASASVGTFRARRRVSRGEELLISYRQGWVEADTPALEMPRSLAVNPVPDVPPRRLEVAKIYCAPSAKHGWGVFAAEDLPIGTTIHESPGRLVPGEQTCFQDDVFATEELLDKTESKNWSVLGLGYATMHNHAEDPNCNFAWGQPFWHGCRVVGRFYTLRKVAKDEELLISYGDEWFKSRNLTPN